MAHGFIRGQLDIRLLILYLLARAVYPLDMAQLLDLGLCDDGVDYFQFTEALTSLEHTGHVQQNEEHRYTITPKGLANGSICEDEIAYCVRLRCDRGIRALNKKMQRQNQIRATVRPREDGNGVTVRMVMDDDKGNLMTLDMLAPDSHQGEVLASAFIKRAFRVYDGVLSALLDEDEEQAT